VSLRSVSSDNFVVVDTTDGEQVIGETDFGSGPSTLHEKAIYIVEGRLFQVERFDYDNRKAFVRRVDCDYYTDAITYTKVTVLDTFERTDGAAGGVAAAPDVVALAAGLENDTRGEMPDLDIPPALTASPGVSQTDLHSTARADDEAGVSCHGEVHVVSRVVGFKKIKFYTNENVGAGELDLPEQQMHTTAYWLTIPAHTMAALPYDTADRRDGVVGLAYAMHHVAPLLLMCDGHDLGLSVDGVSLEGASRMGGLTSRASETELSAEPSIFLYDNYPGGIGLSEPLFAMHAALLDRTRELISGCPCESGCPSCVGPEGATGPLAKAVASRLLDRLVAARAAA
jgi:DEAD/DEAH box helicase domain-containing protein